jgi:Uma2 family endonuclease
MNPALVTVVLSEASRGGDEIDVHVRSVRGLELAQSQHGLPVGQPEDARETSRLVRHTLEPPGREERRFGRHRRRGGRGRDGKRFVDPLVSSAPSSISHVRFRDPPKGRRDPAPGIGRLHDRLAPSPAPARIQPLPPRPPLRTARWHGSDSHSERSTGSRGLSRSTIHDPPFTIHTRLTASGGGFYRSGMGTLRLELPPHGAQTERNERRWRELLADPELARFEGRIETNRYGHIVVTPPPTPKHGSLQSEIAHLLRIRLSHGRVITECPVSTADGVKAADVAWASADAMRALGDRVSFPRAPEVCVEIVSPRNTEAEIREKAALYHDAGAQEVWVCSDAGVMTFLGAGEPAPMEASRIFRDFPVRIVLS